MTQTLSLPISLADLLHGRSVESERLEFKAGWNPESILHTMCAFANDFHNLGGGYIVVGVAEVGGQAVLPPSGLEPSELDRIQKEILRLSHNAIQPPYHPVMMPAVFEGRSILVLWCPGGETRPYSARVSLAKGKKHVHWLHSERLQHGQGERGSGTRADVPSGDGPLRRSGESAGSGRRSGRQAHAGVS